MKVFVNGQLFDTEHVPITIVMKGDSEKKRIIDILSDMPPKEGYRFYVEVPDGFLSEENVDNLVEEIKKLLP